MLVEIARKRDAWALGAADRHKATLAKGGAAEVPDIMAIRGMMAQFAADGTLPPGATLF